MNAKFLNPSNYFGPAELEQAAIEGRDPTYRILAVNLEDIEDTNNKTKRKGSITLEGSDKQWLSNVTNTKCLIAMFGDETDLWIGKRVTLFPDRVMAFGEWTLGVRVKGSPDIAKPVSLKLKLKKKREQVLTMAVTGSGTTVPSSSPPKSNGNGLAKPPHDQMWSLFVAAGLKDGAQFHDLVRQSTGKPSNKASITADDLPKFEKMLAALTSPAGMDAPPLDESAPPPN